MGQVGRRSVLKAAAVVSSAMLVPVAAGPATVARAAGLHGRRYGVAVRADRLADTPGIAAALAADCQWITPEFDWNWDALEYAPGTWWWQRGDALARFADTRHKAIRGHSLIWDQSTPAWAKADMAQRRDWGLVERWFAAVLGRYGQAACEWDVVNEAIDPVDGDAGLRRTAFQRAFGNGYVARAFHTARALAPGLRLMLNEYGLEYRNPAERDRRHALLRTLERLVRDGVPVDGVGLQAHLDLSKGPLDAPAITAMLREIAGMGLHVTITELDVMEADRSQPLPRRDAAVADAIRRYLDIVLAEPVVRGVTCWGLSDRDSWLQGQPGAEAGVLNRGLPLDAGFRPKPAYWALRDALAEPPRQA